jgi:hypothetical protein
VPTRNSLATKLVDSCWLLYEYATHTACTMESCYFKWHRAEFSQNVLYSPPPSQQDVKCDDFGRSCWKKWMNMPWFTVSEKDLGESEPIEIASRLGSLKWVKLDLLQNSDHRQVFNKWKGKLSAVAENVFYMFKGKVAVWLCSFARNLPVAGTRNYKINWNETQTKIGCANF